LEEAHIKLSSLISDLLGESVRRMLQAVVEGTTSPEAIATLADQRLRATAQQLSDALGACRDIHPLDRQLLKMALEELKLMEEQIDKLEQEMASLLCGHQNVVQRLAEVPGLGVDSAQQIVAEVGPTAAALPSAKHLASPVGVCPAEEERAGVNYSERSLKGNRQMKGLRNSAAARECMAETFHNFEWIGGRRRDARARFAPAMPSR
jgi:transposase